MTKTTAEMIEKAKATFGGNWFTSKDVEKVFGNRNKLRTIYNNAKAEIKKETEVITITITETAYNEFLKKYGERMDTTNFGGVGMVWTENNIYYQKVRVDRYHFI